MDAALPPTGPASVTLSRDLRMAGFDQAELRRLTRAGDLVRVRRGAYAEAAADDSEGRHRQLIAATVADSVRRGLREPPVRCRASWATDVA